ncbi:hypothetical protein D3C85_726440 [compost metagenome]
MQLKSPVLIDGKEWKLFNIEFQSPDGKFSAYLYAIDHEHASYQVESLSKGFEVHEMVEQK